MTERDTTDWLTSRGKADVLTVAIAEVLAQVSPLGWYIAPCAQNRFCIGKFTPEKYASRHIVTDEAGQALTFPTIEAAKDFLSEQLGILTPQIFDI